MTSRVVLALTLVSVLTACGARVPLETDPSAPIGVQAVNSVGTTGTIDANGETVSLTLNDRTAASVQATGTWSGTIEIETTTDGTNWVSLDLTPSDSATATSTFTANGLWQGSAGGRQIRVRSTAWSSGEATISLNAYPGSFGGGGGGGGTNTEYTEAASDSTITGIAMMGEGATADELTVVKMDDDGHLQIDVLSGAGSTTPLVLDTMDATTGWTVLNDDAANIATDTKGFEGVGSLEFDKADGTSNTVYAIIQKTISSTDLTSLSTTSLRLTTYVNIPTPTNVVNYLVRLGTDASNYNEWVTTALGATGNAWERVDIDLGETTQVPVGNGWDPSAVTYMALGLQFSAETNTLVDILWDVVSVTAPGATRAFIAGPLDADGQVNVGGSTLDDISSSVQATEADINTIANNLATDGTHNTTAQDAGPESMSYAADFDGSALPGAAAAEGRTVHTAATLSGIRYAMMVNEDGSKELALAEDAPYASGQLGVTALGVRNNTLGTLVDTNLDNAPFQFNSSGALWTDVATLNGNAIDLGNGTVGSATLRVSVASDTTGVLSVDDNGATLSIDDGAGNISIDDGGNIITVDGTVTADLGATDNAVLDDIANGIPLDAGANNIGQVETLGANDVRPIHCDSTYIIDTTADVQAVALSGSTVVYVCGFVLTAEGTVDVRLISGTGSVCGTGTTAETVLYALTADRPVASYPMGATRTASGGALCVDVSAAVQVNGEIHYAQF